MRFALLTLTACFTLSTAIVAVEKPVVAERPNAKNSVAAAKPQSPVIPFAQHDVARLQAHVQAMTKKAAGIKDAKAKAAADAAVKSATAKLTQAQQRLELLKQGKTEADPKSIHLLGSFKLERPGLACRFDPQGNYVFAGAQDKKLYRFDLITGERTDLAGHDSWVRRFDMNDSGETMFTGSYAGRLIWWKPNDTAPKPMRTVEAHKGYVRGVAVSPDGKLVATGGNDNMVRVWSAVDGKLIKELSGHERHVYNVKFDPSGKYLVSGDLLGVLKQWEVGSWKLVRDLDAKSALSKYDKTFRAVCGGIRGMDFSPDGKYLVVCGIGKVTNAFAGVGEPTAVLFDFTTGKRLKVMVPAKKYRGTCWGVKWHPSGKFFVGAGGNNAGELWFWKPDSDKSFFNFKVPSNAYDIAFHPDGLRLAVALYNKTVSVYDLAPKAAKPQTAKKKKKSRKK